jgi:hypothetical protein
MRARYAVLAVVAARIAIACTDGVTPDCSDPSVCAPSYGDAAAILPDAATDAEASSPVDSASPTPDAADAADADGG